MLFWINWRSSVLPFVLPCRICRSHPWNLFRNAVLKDEVSLKCQSVDLSCGCGFTGVCANKSIDKPDWVWGRPSAWLGLESSPCEGELGLGPSYLQGCGAWLFVPAHHERTRNNGTEVKTQSRHREEWAIGQVARNGCAGSVRGGFWDLTQESWATWSDPTVALALGMWLCYGPLRVHLYLNYPMMFLQAGTFIRSQEETSVPFLGIPLPREGFAVQQNIRSKNHLIFWERCLLNCKGSMVRCTFQS